MLVLTGVGMSRVSRTYNIECSSLQLAHGSPRWHLSAQHCNEGPHVVDASSRSRSVHKKELNGRLEFQPLVRRTLDTVHTVARTVRHCNAFIGKIRAYQRQLLCQNKMFWLPSAVSGKYNQRRAYLAWLRRSESWAERGWLSGC